jgi:carboxymethylenebutenolidase
VAGSDLTSVDVRLGPLRVHVARPAQQSGVGVLLYPTIRGLDETMRQAARMLAAAGMCAVVWDQYNGEDVTGDITDLLARSRQCEDSTVVHDLTTVVDFMHDDLALVSVAGLGYCFGGRIALIHAGNDDRIRAVGSYHPSIFLDAPIMFGGRPLSRADFPEQTMDEFALAAAINGPVQISQPEQDFTLQAAYDRLRAALLTRPEPTFFEYHPGAQHGFAFAPGEANDRAIRYARATTTAIFAERFRTL